MNKEIEIPEGYEARIEGNKVILELKDEKIRKVLVSIVKWLGFDSSFFIDNSIAKSEVIAYLEKQKEQKPMELERLEKLREMTKEIREAYERGIEVGKRFEQKPANNIKPKFRVGDRVNKNDREDEEYCILTITSVNIDEHCYVCNQCSVIDFEEQDLWHIVEQKPAEWSEEDEKFFKTALWHISYSVSNGKTTDCHCDTTDWLKGVKERLKALRSHWKPSEEQLEALAWYSGNSGVPPTGDKAIKSLYTDLQKLL